LRDDEAGRGPSPGKDCDKLPVFCPDFDARPELPFIEKLSSKRAGLCRTLNGAIHGKICRGVKGEL
jgi:hypothetical protein